MPLRVAGSMWHPVLEGYFGTNGLCSLGVLSFVDHSVGHPLVPATSLWPLLLKGWSPRSYFTFESVWGDLFLFFILGLFQHSNLK